MLHTGSRVFTDLTQAPRPPHPLPSALRVNARHLLLLAPPIECVANSLPFLTAFDTFPADLVLVDA